MCFVISESGEPRVKQIVTSRLYQRTAAGEDVWLGWVNSDAADVIRVGLKHVDPLQGVVVEHTDLHIILCKRRKEMFSNLYNLHHNLLEGYTTE